MYLLLITPFFLASIFRYYPTKRSDVLPCPVINEETDYWANDKMIACWINQLREIDMVMCESDSLRPKTLFIDPINCLHTLIVEKKWSVINRLYIRGRKKAKLSFVDYDRIIVPVSERSHSTFQTIYLNKRAIVHTNSFNNSSASKNKSPSLLLDFVEYFSTLDHRSFDRQFWKVVPAKTIEQVYYL